MYFTLWRLTKSFPKAKMVSTKHFLLLNCIRSCSPVAISCLEKSFYFKLPWIYLQSTEDDLDWNRHNGSTPTILSGPSRDHTTGTNLGHYLYIEASNPNKFGDKAWLESMFFNVRIYVTKI